LLELSACQVTAASHWASLSWKLFNLLLQQHLVLPVLAGTIAARWVLPWKRWRRPVSRVGMVLLIGYLVISTPIVAKVGGRGLTAFIPADAGQPADAIVILGRGREFRPSRVQVAADLWRAGRAPAIFASGRGDAIEIGQMLEKKEIPASAIDGEPCSATTNENAEFTAAILQPQGVKRIVLVTDPPHMLRSALTFASLGFEVIPHTSPIPQQLDKNRQTFLVFREWVGLVSYGMMGRYFSRQLPETTLKTQLSSPVSGSENSLTRESSVQ
jgi:uncharacterized SAM-binding protein YcdF (DUF218 family)